MLTLQELSARNNWLLRLKRVDGRWLITKWTIATVAHPTATRASTMLPRHEPHRTVRLPVRSSSKEAR